MVVRVTPTLLENAVQVTPMSAIGTAWKVTDGLVTVVATLVVLWLWLEAILAWGNAYAFADALLATVTALIVFGVTSAINYVRKRRA